LNKLINKIYLDNQNVYFIIQNNIFQNNFANENGGCIFISNLNSTGQITLLGNFFISNGISFDIKNNNISLGSIIYLENPSNIFIENSNFFNNSGILGTCIYYSESYQDYSIILQRNIFNNNMALIAAAGIYYAQLDKNIDSDIQKNNKFWNNKAGYGQDFSSPPFRMNQNLNKFGSQNFNHLTTIIPGITSLNFSLSVLDFYNQKIMNLTYGSLCFVAIKNFKDFSDIDQIHSTISLEGFSTVNFINGFLIK